MRHQKCLFDLPRADLSDISRSLAADVDALRTCRIFLSGGTGFFGKWLLGALAFAHDELDLDLHVTVLSRDPARFLKKYPEAADHRAIQFLCGEMETLAFPAGRFDFVLHAATDTMAITTDEQEKKREQSIIRGTERMLNLAREGGARRFLNISSGGIYGVAAGRLAGAREEDDAQAAPLTIYGRAKLEAERRCLDSEVDFSTARAFAFLGPHLPLDAHYAAGNFLRDAHRGGPIEVRGDGTALRSYLYPSDLVTWLLRILLRGQKGRAYNVGSEEIVSTGGLAWRIAEASAPTPEIITQFASPQGPCNVYLPDVTRAQNELGLRMQVVLDDAIRRTLAWLNLNRQAGA